MHRFRRSHCTDSSLLHSAKAHLGEERTATAELLADLAEIDARRLFLLAGYSSMYAWCLGELHLCEQAAYKRIQAARAARRFPAVFQAVADGRLHLSAIVLLAPYLIQDTAEDLLTAASHKTKAEIERLLAERFPRPDLPAGVAPIPPVSPSLPVAPAPGAAQTSSSPVPERVGDVGPEASGSPEARLSPGIVPGALGPVPASFQHRPVPIGDRSRVIPLAPGRYGVQFTFSQSALDKLHYARSYWATRFPRAISPRSSSGRSMPWSENLRKPSSRRPTGRAGRVRARTHATSHCTSGGPSGIEIRDAVRT